MHMVRVQRAAVTFLSGRCYVGGGKLEEEEGYGLPRGAVHTLQLILQTLLENGPESFNKG